jgi:hypothetical protein
MGKRVEIIEFVYCQCRCRACRMQARVVAKYAHVSAFFFGAKDGNAALLRLSDERVLIECCDHADQRKRFSSINQRLIYGYLEAWAS